MPPPFTAGLIAKKLEEEGLQDEVKLKIIPMGGTLKLGPFGFTYVALAHSIPEGNALIIDTPYGRIFHTGDWKLDDAPQMGTPASAAQLTAIGDSGILALIGDSTNVFNPEASGSEADVRDGLMRVVKARKSGRVLVTTFASNAARLGTLGAVAKACGRELVLAGRSMDRIVGVAPRHWLFERPARTHRLGHGDEPAAQQGADPVHRRAGRTNGGAVAHRRRQPPRNCGWSRAISSSIPPSRSPGNELSIGRVQNALATRGIDVITEKQAHVHVSGHPGQPELEAMYEWIRPEIAIPVHGERRHMEEHAKLAKECGVPKAMVPINGSAIRLAPDGPKLLSHEPAGRLVLDGDVILPADGATIVERRRMANYGLIAVSVVIGKNGLPAATPKVSTHGVPVEEDKDDFLAECAEAAEKAAAKGDSETGRALCRSHPRCRAPRCPRMDRQETGDGCAGDASLKPQSALAIYLLFWTLTLFAVLPLRRAHPR